jgi:hypothetical protein
LLDDSKWCCGANVLSHAAHQPHCCCRAIITNLLDGLMVLESEEKLNPTQKQWVLTKNGIKLTPNGF